MPQRREKAEGSAPRKRALISCDRCKLRRARCIRDNTDEPCADCKLAGVQCESKLPRKQRVYGSVETLSLRYRALESLVKGLFPEDNVQDTNVIFALATARNISMPDSDDYTPANIFHNSGQQPLPSQPAQLQEHLRSTLSVHHLRQSPLVLDQLARSSSTSSQASPIKAVQHNPFSELQPSIRQPDDLIQNGHDGSQYIGRSSSFRLAVIVQTLLARYKAAQSAQLPRHHNAATNTPGEASQGVTEFQVESTRPIDEGYTFADRSRPQPASRVVEERSSSEVGATGKQPRRSGTDFTWEHFEDLLPSKSLADTLVSAYFDRIHVFMPIFHRDFFQHQLDATYTKRPEVLQEVKGMGWLICLAMVFALGCEQLPEHDQEQAQILRAKYLDFAKTHFPKLLMTASVTNVQALLLFNLYYHTLGHKSTSWLLIGLATRMAITLGMHRCGSNDDFDPTERDIRRQVFWSIYVLERILCSIFGRPTVLDDAEIKMRLPDASMLEQQGASTELLGNVFEVAQMSYKIRQRAYFDATTADERSPSLSVAIGLLRECNEFYPKVSRYDISIPAPPSQRAMVSLLHVYYCYTRCIITRDFLIQKVERDISHVENRLPPISEDWDTTFALSEDCVESAHQILQCILSGQDLGLTGYSYAYIDFFFVFHAIIIVCVDFLARPKEKQVLPKDKERKDVVRSMLDRVRGINRLAPTYITLMHIALQLASMTDIYEEPVDPENLLSKSGGPSPQGQSGSGHDSVMSTVDVEEDWFASATERLCLAFFDLNQSTGVPRAARPGNPGLPDYMQPMVNQADDWTARTSRGMHNFDQ